MATSYPGARDYPTYKILECIDMTPTGEYWDLDDKDREFIQMILSCGTVRFSVGAPLRDALFALFPEGTTTRANLLACLGWEFPPV